MSERDGEPPSLSDIRLRLRQGETTLVNGSSRKFSAKERAAHGQQIVVSLTRQFSWTHFIALLPIIKNALQRDFYAELCLPASSVLLCPSFPLRALPLPLPATSRPPRRA
jgi:hypothetical protein